MDTWIILHDNRDYVTQENAGLIAWPRIGGAHFAGFERAARFDNQKRCATVCKRLSDFWEGHSLRVVRLRADS